MYGRGNMISDATINFSIRVAIIVLCIAIILWVANKIIQGALRSKDMAQRQNISVIARYRNKVTASLWADAMDIRVGGILPIGEKIEDWLYAMFPRAMEDLEVMRTKNPAAWREVMKYLLPLAITLKVVALYKGQEALQNVMGWVQNLLEGNKEPSPEDQSVDQDLNTGGS